MTTLNSNTIPSDRQAMLARLDHEAAEFLQGALKERFTVIDPNGGISTEVREIIIDETTTSQGNPSAPMATG